MNLPAEFVSNIRNVFKERGDAFLLALPDSIAEASAKWNLTDVVPVPTLSYNFVAFANRGDTKVALKMGVPNPELLSEIEALRAYDGEGACKLIDADEENSWMLLERLIPGEMLVTMEDDDEATRIAAQVMKKIWRPVHAVPLSQEQQGSAVNLHQDERDPSLALRMTDTSRFIKLSNWFDGLKQLRIKFNGETGPLDEKIVRRVERWISDAFSEDHNPVLMHGDFHHYNILSSERGWLIIDPKGVIGPAGYEVGPLLMNPWEQLLKMNSYRLITRRRIDILHEHLGFERQCIREWALAHAVLSAWWSIGDDIDDEYAIRFAEMMASLDL